MCALEKLAGLLIKVEMRRTGDLIGRHVGLSGDIERLEDE